MKEKFDVTGMTCSACSSRVEKCVSKLEGIENVSVNLLTNSMQVEYNDTVLSESQIIDAVVKAGYGASPKQEHVQTVAAGKAKVMENPMEKQIQNMKFRLIVSFVFLVPLMYVSMGPYGGTSVARIFDRDRKCGQLCFYSIIALSSDYLCKS